MLLGPIRVKELPLEELLVCKLDDWFMPLLFPLKVQCPVLPILVLEIGSSPSLMVEEVN